MPSTIVLRNAIDAAVTYVESAHRGSAIDYISVGTSLLDSSKLTLEIRKNAGTNRILAKLSIPTTGTVPSTGMQGVLWTEVGSFDLSSVLAASTTSAENFMAQFKSLVGLDAVKLMYTTGVHS